MRRELSGLARGAALATTFLLVTGVPAAWAKPGTLTVLSTTDAVGSIKPCGCHTPKGGFARIASLVDSTRMKGDAVLVEAGDFAPDATRAFEDSKIDFQFDVMGLIGYDAVGIGERELAFGLDRLKAASTRSKLPIVSSNLVDAKTGQPVFHASRIVKKGGVKVGIFSLLSPKITLTGKDSANVRVEDPLATAQRMVAELRKEADVVVCLAHLGRVDGEDLGAQLAGIDVIVLAHHPGNVMQGRRINGGIAVASGEQIQNIGVTRVQLDGKKVIDVTSETKVLLPEVGERADIARLTKDFEDRQNAAAKASTAQPATQPAGSH
jgi:2',3'-cyclic-nucleotide 2'-phosphodiesterase (5'-nucleotidase family)